MGELFQLPTLFSTKSTVTAVTIDPWAPNALADDLQQAMPVEWNMAIAEAAPVPKMFADGTADLPTFTASGVDPALLMRMPARCRHYLAACPDRDQLFELFEMDQSNAYAGYGCDGQAAALRRLADWAAGKYAKPLTQIVREQEDREFVRKRELAAALESSGGILAYQRLADRYAREDDAASTALMADIVALTGQKSRQQARADMQARINGLINGSSR